MTEQLFAVGYAACFQSALMGVARGHNLDASGSQITSRVDIGPTGHGGFGLAVSLDLHAPNLTAGLARATAREQPQLREPVIANGSTSRSASARANARSAAWFAAR